MGGGGRGGSEVEWWSVVEQTVFMFYLETLVIDLKGYQSSEKGQIPLRCKEKGYRPVDSFPFSKRKSSYTKLIVAPTLKPSLLLRSVQQNGTWSS